MKKSVIIISSILSMSLMLGCATLSLNEVNKGREKIDTMASNTIEQLSKKDPSIKKALENAKGYLVINWKVTKVPVVGVGGGNGVIVDLRNNKRVYINVSRFDLGGGWGARSYKNLIITNNEEMLNDALNGSLKFEAGAEVSAGTAALEGGSSNLNSKVQTYVLSDGGGSATATIRVLYSTLNDDLN